MRKDHKNTIAEYVGSLSEEDLRFLSTRLYDKMEGDVGDALQLIGRHPSMDHVFGSAKSALELFDLCDYVSDVTTRESKRRSGPRLPRD